MNQGKPTRPKWWNRGPREAGPTGDFELQRPTAPTADEPPSPEAPTEPSTDYELAGPAEAPTGESAESAVPRGSEADGDAGLGRNGEAESSTPAEGAESASPPVDSVSEPAVASPAPAPESETGGDFELARPAEVSADLADTARQGEVEASAPAAVVPEGGSAPVEGPKPLHDPDPYSTPPYGEPGPWAPAPPVQHPAATSAPPGDPAASPWQNYDPWAAVPLQQTGTPVDDEVRRRRRVRRALVGGAVGLALVSGGVGGVVGAYVERNGDAGTVALPQAGKEPAGRAPDSVAAIAARALPSVVTLHVSGANESGTGTGFVLDDQGHILTNNHVVQPAGSSGDISVTFNDGDTAKATVVGRDTGYDLAVVKVSGVSDLKPMPLGNSDNVQVGDPVVAIGAPFDLSGTVTSGIISAKERPITAGGDSSDGSDVSYVDALQTDAPINPGNSGGPLLDSHARVIGINSAIRSADGSTDSGTGQSGSIGLGFAIPVNQAKRVAEELISSGKATHPVIGVTLDMNYTGDGARVAQKADGGGPAVSKAGPGDKAGIEAGDLITAVDGERVHSGEELIVRTRAHRPGDRLQLTVVRDGVPRTVTLVLGSSGGS
ncbi:trypsin-like peptidase domain-containing protein [Streptomyces sp. NPDC101152]|uniref:trypsin-like peptidase domain-containing protein n=1 Tax=Streptomyces sp. NPDC101152 TaxID=3366116 RepID=UPI0037F19697